MLIGSRRLFDCARENPRIRLRSSEYTHDPRVLAGLPKFVAINSAVEVDLTGQVNAEVAKGSYLGAVGGALDFMRAHLADDIGAFLAQYPAVRVSLDERVSPEVVRAVREGSAELGVLWDLTDLSGLHVQRYRGDRLSLVMRDDHPLAGARALSFEQALEHATVGVAPGGMTDLLLHREAARLGRQLAYRVQVSGLDATARIVAAGLGAAILPREALPPRALESGLVAVPLSDAWAARRIVVCSRDVAGLSAAARRLRDHLQRAAEDATSGSRSA